MSFGCMAAAFLRLAKISLPTMQRDKRKTLEQQKAVVRVGEFGVFWSEGTAKSAIPDSMNFVVGLVELFNFMVEVDG